MLKGVDFSYLNNYRVISKVCILAKVFEKIVSNGLDEFFKVNYILFAYQSGFMKRYSTVTANLKVYNDKAVGCQKKGKKK